MKKLLFAISITLFSLLGLQAYAADNAATTHGLNSNHMRSMDSLNQTMPATDNLNKPADEKKPVHKKTHKKSSKKGKHTKKHTKKK
jgi:hypothetical protein